MNSQLATQQGVELNHRALPCPPVFSKKDNEAHVKMFSVDKQHIDFLETSYLS